MPAATIKAGNTQGVLKNKNVAAAPTTNITRVMVLCTATFKIFSAEYAINPIAMGLINLNAPITSFLLSK